MKKVVVLAVATVFLVLALAGVALAATAQDIYNDFADNGKLEGDYTTAELNAYLGDATLHQYGDQAKLAELDAVVHGIVGGREQFPFTGAQIALMAIAACALIGGGIGLRRLRRSRA
jgi:hypothetical protein